MYAMFEMNRESRTSIAPEKPLTLSIMPWSMNLRKGMLDTKLSAELAVLNFL